MKRLVFFLLPLLCLAAAPGEPAALPSRFTYVDVMIDPKGQPLAAWQFEFSAAVGIYTDAPHALQQQGAPVKVIGADPVFVQLQLVGLGAQAPDPNAAKLFISWLVGDDGQAGLDAVGVVPARPDKYQAATAFIGAPNTVIIGPALAAKAGDSLAEFNQILGIK